MSKSAYAARLIDTLTRELTLLDRYNKGCEELHRQLVARDWGTLENIINGLRQDAAALESLDGKRESIIRILKKKEGLQEESSFGMLLSRLDADLQSEIKMLKSKLRHAVNILQARLKGIGNYSENQQILIKDVLEELVPDQKGQIYNSRGYRSTGENKPLLVNQSF